MVSINNRSRSSSDRSESIVSDDFPSAFLSPSPEGDDDDDDTGLDFDLDAIETPSDSESLPFPIYDLDLEGERAKVETAGCLFFKQVFNCDKVIFKII